MESVLFGKLKLYLRAKYDIYYTIHSFLEVLISKDLLTILSISIIIYFPPSSFELIQTKRWNGLDPDLGGYPTPIDTRYPFEYAADFQGQPGAGSPHHCAVDYDPNSPIQACPKLITDNDDGEYGIGHTPPHIGLAVVRSALSECAEDEFADWFDFESETAPCDIKPDVLASMIRAKYPRDPDTGAVDYPPPVVPGSFEYFELEFPSPEGPPHWCTPAFWESGQWADFCPYVFEGENAGKYRHPHLALSATMQYIANSINPSVCGVEWDDRGQYPLIDDSSIAWADMESNEGDAQPTLPYSWPENGDTQVKNVPGLILLVPTESPPTEEEPIYSSEFLCFFFSEMYDC